MTHEVTSKSTCGGTVCVLSPVAGTVVSLAHVDDAVFQSGMVGFGIAIIPDHDAQGYAQFLSPVDGKIIQIMPHAFVIVMDNGAGLLVHVGIDTVGLGGEGFVLHARKKEIVSTGAPLIDANISGIRAAGLDPVCPVVVMQSQPETIHLRVIPGAHVASGDPLFDYIP